MLCGKTITQARNKSVYRNFTRNQFMVILKSNNIKNNKNNSTKNGIFLKENEINIKNSNNTVNSL